MTSDAESGEPPPAPVGDEKPAPAATTSAAAAGADPGEPAEEGPASAQGATGTRDGGFERRHPDALRLEMAIGGGVVGCASLGALALATVLAAFAGFSPWLVVLAAMVPVILAFPLLVVPRWRHRRYLYRVDERGLEIRQGVWWRSHRFIPHTRLQHTDVAQGPLERQFGLATLVVHTAGTHAARTTVSGLALESARRLRDRLTGDGGGADDGV